MTICLFSAVQTAIGRAKLAWRLAKCALLHGMGEHLGGWRCSVCAPLRRRKRKAGAVLQAERPLEGAE